jgi:thiamine biosynthesis protein ThiI
VQPARLVVTPAPELHLKSRRSRRRLLALLGDRIATLAGTGVQVQRGPGERFTLLLSADAPRAVLARRVAHCFGVGRVDEVEPVDASTIDTLVRDVAPLAAGAVAGRGFAARVRRRGEPTGWSGPDAERALGAALLAAAPSAHVDLSNPDVTVRVEVVDRVGWWSSARHEGPRGLPLGSGAPMLALLSGGIDSPVAAWLMMRTGSPVHFVHFSLGCAGTDHAAAVASGLVERWAAGTSPQLAVVPFEKVAEAIVATADPALTQVHLKQAMLAAAERVARHLGVDILVTGDAVGQVSSQTAANLVAIDRATDLLVLRPLTAMHKDEITARARAIGTYEVSTRAVERCDLSTGPVAIAANPARVARGWAAFDRSLVDTAVAAARRIDVRRWVPGDPGAPVTPAA